MYTKDFDLSNHKDVHLGFYSHYAQNQDGSGSVEYSIDEGETWLPIVYMLDQADIVRDDEGNVDAFTTLEQEHADIAVGYDPDTFEEVGGYYGAYIGAEISEALAPYISGRINDNQTESKRYELFRLPEADGEKTVRFRLAKSGTYSWYWGIDNFGLYSIAPSSMLEVVEASPAAGSQGANPMPLLTFVIKNGEAKLDPTSVKLEFNGTAVEGSTVTEIKIGAEDGHQFTYQVTDLLEPLSQNSFKLTYTEDSGENRMGTYEGSFTVAEFTKRTLPSPLAFESFDDLEEFALPEGWSTTSYVNEADTIFWDEDPDDWTSMTYSGWANVSLDRWKTGPYWNEKSQAANPPVFINGKAQFPSGNFLIADSALRNANFVTVIETQDFDLSEAADVHLGFTVTTRKTRTTPRVSSTRSTAGTPGCRCSTCWTKPTSSPSTTAQVDAEATLNAAHGDVALVNNILFQDDDEIWDMEPLEEALGGSYGAFIGAEIDDSLAPYISGRVDDNRRVSTLRTAPAPQSGQSGQGADSLRHEWHVELVLGSR